MEIQVKGPGKSCNLLGHGCKNIEVHTPLIFMIHTYSDKTFFFATCDSDAMDATVMLLYVE